MKFLVFFLISISLFACKGEPIDSEIQFSFNLMESPKGFPEIITPEGNEFTQERWELGKKLFYDKTLSIDKTVSCGSCHKSNLAFSDDLPTTPGVENREGTRNSPTLANVGFQPYFTREGGIPTLEMQVLVPIQEHNEFGFNIVLIAERLREDSIYSKLAQVAYGQDINPFVITRAISNFERSLISGYSRYDQFVNYNKPTALTSAEQNGMHLFFSESLNCVSCHSGFNFTNYSFGNNGLYEEYEDPGRYRFTNDESDLALFKVPTLRNIGLTAPYMHDGSLATLEEVVEHYNSGGKNHIHKSEFIKPLGLTETEMKELVLFLHSLTDENFIANKLFSDN